MQMTIQLKCHLRIGDKVEVTDPAHPYHGWRGKVVELFSANDMGVIDHACVAFRDCRRDSVFINDLERVE